MSILSVGGYNMISITRDIIIKRPYMKHNYVHILTMRAARSRHSGALIIQADLLCMFVSNRAYDDM
jgi:hypothetical protein